MRNPAFVLESLKSYAKTPDYGYERLYRNLYNPEFFLLAYQNIYAKQGNMTPGADGKTIDGMSMTRIEKIIAKLKDHSYSPNPAKRHYIEKKSRKGKRPLGIPSIDDKLVQEVLRLILESIYEPTFCPTSHGFRPKRSCHTALAQIQDRFTGVEWFVEGDIKGFFDNIDHHTLIGILRRRIKDEYLIGLIWKFLKAGYLEDWTFHNTYSGTPQGSVISPILANIYLNELDWYMDTYKEQFECGKYRETRKEYRHNQHLVDKAVKKYREKWADMSAEERREAALEVKELKQQVRATRRLEPNDANYRRIWYTRYADDFIIGIIGSKQDAEQVKADIKVFLNGLKLEMSEEKTLITNSRDKARFLGYDVTVARKGTPSKTKNGKIADFHSGRVKLYVPKEKWVKKLSEYQAMKIKGQPGQYEKWIPMHRKNLLHKGDYEIVQQYNWEIRGLYNFYRLANNASVINKFYYIMRYSMMKTFASKYNTTVSKIAKKYLENKRFKVNYPTRNGEKAMYLYDSGFKTVKAPYPGELDTLPAVSHRTGKNGLISRVRARVCEWCWQKEMDVEVHHVMNLTKLRGSKGWERVMISRRRKTLVLCKQCHEDLHNGLLD